MHNTRWTTQQHGSWWSSTKWNHNSWQSSLYVSHHLLGLQGQCQHSSSWKVFWALKKSIAARFPTVSKAQYSRSLLVPIQPAVTWVLLKAGSVLRNSTSRFKYGSILRCMSNILWKWAPSSPRDGWLWITYTQFQTKTTKHIINNKKP